MVFTIIFYIAVYTILHKINKYKNKYHQGDINDAFYEMVKSWANFSLLMVADILREWGKRIMVHVLVKNGRFIPNFF